MNWGPITFVPFVPFVSWKLLRPDGVQLSMRLAAILSFTACAIRLVPALLPTDARRTFVATLPLHLAQILNGVAGPVLIAAPSRLSALWFPPGQRATVTAVANSSLFGAAVGFYLGPAIVGEDPDRVLLLLFVCFGLSAVPLALVLAYCPPWPHAVASAPRAETGVARMSDLDFFRAARKLVSSEPTMLALMAASALGAGMYDCWIGVLPQLLTGSQGCDHHRRGNHHHGQETRRSGSYRHLVRVRPAVGEWRGLPRPC